MQGYFLAFFAFRLQVLLGIPQNHHHSITRAHPPHKSIQQFTIIFWSALQAEFLWFFPIFLRLDDLAI